MVKRRMAKFTKVSYEQFKKDWLKVFGKYNENLSEELLEKTITYIYDNIKLPTRATEDSAGYDFHIPFSLILTNGEPQVIPTGVRCEMESGWVMKCYPRSGQGFKYGLHLANTVGIIDADYAHADNEGHIHIKLVNDSILASIITFNPDDKFCQGVFVPYGITYDDDVETERTGGFGSTGA